MLERFINVFRGLDDLYERSVKAGQDEKYCATKILEEYTDILDLLDEMESKNIITEDEMIDIKRIRKEYRHRYTKIIHD